MYICVLPRENYNTNFSYRVVICDNLQWYFKKTLMWQICFIFSRRPIQFQWALCSWICSERVTSAAQINTEITCSSDKAQSKQGQLLYFCREIMVSVSWAAESPVNHKQITDTLVCSPFTIQEMRNYSSGLTVTPINLLPHNCSFIQKNGDSTHKNFTLMTARKKTHSIFFPCGKWNLGTCRF